MVDPLVISHMGISQIGWIRENGYTNTITPKGALCNDPVSGQVIISLSKVVRHVIMADPYKNVTLKVRYTDELKDGRVFRKMEVIEICTRNEKIRVKENHFPGGRESERGSAISQVKCKKLQVKKEAASKEAASSLCK